MTCPFLRSLIFLLKIICVYLLRKKSTVGEGEEVGGGGGVRGGVLKRFNYKWLFTAIHMIAL